MNYGPEEVVALLQANGIAAGVVENAKDLFEDPQLKHRGHFVTVDHPEMGQYRAEAPPYKLSETPSQVYRHGPCLGEDTEYVCTQILGLSDQEFIELSNEGVFW